MIFCPNCGSKIQSGARLCPNCHEVLPAPNTVLGYEPAPDKPSTRPGAPDVEEDIGQAPATHPSPVLFPPIPENLPIVVAPGTSRPPDPQPQLPPVPRDVPVLVSPLAQSYPNVTSEMGRPAEANVVVVAPPPAASAPQEPAPAASARREPAPVVSPAFVPGALPPADPPLQPQPQVQLAAAQLQTAEQQPAAFVYGGPVVVPPSGQVGVEARVTGASKSTSLGLAPSDTRRGLVWRTVAGGALLTWGLVFLLLALSFTVMHATILLRHGYWNAHESLLAASWISVGACVPSTLILVAGAGWLSGRGSPRALAFAGFVTNTLWIGAAIGLLATFFHPDPLVVWSMIASGSTVLATAVCMGLVIASNRWMAGRPRQARPRSVPYPLWAGPLLIVLGSVTVLRLMFSLVGILVKLKMASHFWRQAREAFGELPVFWGAVSAILICAMVVVAGIGLLRRSRWSVALGGAAGVLAFLTLVTVPLALVIQNRLGAFGGISSLPLVIWVLASHGVAAWIALGGAVRYRFQLPPYLRDGPGSPGDGRRPELMEVLMRPAPTLPG